MNKDDMAMIRSHNNKRTEVLFVQLGIVCLSLNIFPTQIFGQSDSMFPAFPGSTYEQRRQAFIADQGKAWELWFPGAMVHAVWAWLERPEGNRARISEAIGYLVGDDCMGWKNCWYDGDLQSPRQLRIYLQYYREKRVITDSDAHKLKDKLREIATSAGVWCAVANYLYRYLVTAYLYTTLIEDVGKVTFPQPSNDQYACPQPFTYNGRSYVSGKMYESREIFRDYLSYKIDQGLRIGDNEDFSDPYYYAQVHSMAALADFAPDGTLRRKGSMFFDFIIFNWAVGLSANHPAGAHGRTYPYAEKDAASQFPWVVFFDLYDKPDIEHRQNYADAYVFKHRFPQLLSDIVEAKNEGDDYYRIIRGYVPELYKAFDSQATSYGYRYDYVTHNYNLGGAGMGTGWELNIKGPDAPFKLWINYCDSPMSACNGSLLWCDGCYSLNFLGSHGYQHRNAIFVKIDNSVLHQWLGDNTWDEQSNESGWRFFREGSVAVAANIGNRSAALEVATIGVDYSTYGQFKDAIRNTTSLTDESYTTTKGVRIYEGYVDYGLDFNSLPFDRLEVWEGHVGQNDETKIVDWNNDVMTVSKYGKTISYDFNNWTVHTDGSSGSDLTPPMPPTGIQVTTP